MFGLACTLVPSEGRAQSEINILDSTVCVNLSVLAYMGFEVKFNTSQFIYWKKYC